MREEYDIEKLNPRTNPYTENDSEVNNQDQHQSSGKKQKNRTYMLTMRQSLSVKPRYDVYRDRMKVIYMIDGDITRHVFTIRKDGIEVMTLRKKLVRLLPEYTLEKDGQEIAHIKKRISLLTHDLSGTFGDQSVEIRPDWDAYRFDILVDGRKLCRIESKTELLSDRYDIMMFDAGMEELAVALAVICDHVSDKEENARANE